MSWIIEHILRNRESIRSDLTIESDEYDDLLVIEKKIDDLYKDGFLSDVDMYIIDMVSDGRPLRELGELFNKGRTTMPKTFVQICERIAYFLGGYFTDEGFLDNMRTEYKLTDESLDEIKLYMNSKFKHQLMKRKKKTK